MAQVVGAVTRMCVPLHVQDPVPRVAGCRILPSALRWGGNAAPATGAAQAVPGGLYVRGVGATEGDRMKPDYSGVYQIGDV